MISRKAIAKNVATVIVEGNIGSGKTTFLNYIQKKFDIKVNIITEPLQKWRDVNGENLFELLYKDPKRWSFAFQMYADLSRLEMHESRGSNVVKVLERSLFSARHCFVENSYKNKLLNEVEYVVLNEFFKTFVRNGKVRADYIIYLRTTPEKCFERVQLRNRSEEKYISLDYLTSLHDLHEKWIYGTDIDYYGKKPQIISLDANVGLDKLEDVYEHCSFIFNEREV